MLCSVNETRNLRYFVYCVRLLDMDCKTNKGTILLVFHGISSEKPLQNIYCKQYYENVHATTFLHAKTFNGK